MNVSIPLAPPRWRARVAALSPRERGFLLAVALAALFLLILLVRPATQEDASVELAPVTLAAPVAPPAPMPAVAPAPPAAVPTGLVLRGVFGGGPGGGAALIAFPDGAERMIRVGREALPGLAVREIGLTFALLGGAGADYRLELGKAGAQPVPAAGGSGQAASAPAGAGGEADQRRETLEYRLGLAPVSAAGGVSGYAIKPGASLPHLARAGLRPGDVIVGVNGSRFDEERLMELSWQINNSARTEFDVIRAGQRMNAQLSR